MALSAAEALLAMQGLGPHHAFLGHCYAAEAMCELGRPQAAEHLLSTFLVQVRTIMIHEHVTSVLSAVTGLS